MTPTAKATYLTELYRTGFMCSESKAREAALVLVREIIQLRLYDVSPEPERTLEYWQEVERNLLTDAQFAKKN